MRLLAERNRVVHQALEEAPEDPHAAAADEQAVERVECVIPGRAVYRPMRPEPFRRIEHLLDDEPRPGARYRFELGSQLSQVAERIEQAIDMIDADAVHDVLRGELADQFVAARED